MDKHSKVSRIWLPLFSYSCLIFSRNRIELENVIKLLITDHVVRKKFTGKIVLSAKFSFAIYILLEWKFSYESFNLLSPSNNFEERYASDFIAMKKKPKMMDELSYSSVLLHLGKNKMHDKSVLNKL